MISLKDKNVLLVNAFDDEIEQEGNGKYQLSFKYPTSDQRWKNIDLADLLLADDLHGEQEFRVFEIVKRNGYIFVYANQVVDDLNSYSISNISVDRVNGQTVMQALAGSIIRKHPFAFYSDIQDRHVFNQKNISVMGALANGKHSIIGQWGGDLVRDKYNVNLLKRGGRESEALFMYKKNLKSYAETNSIKGLFTRLNLSVKNSDIKTTVDSPLIGSYGGRVYELNVEVADQDVATLEQLQEYGRNYFAEKLIDVPNNSLTISVTDSQEYDVRIFDTVFVHHEIFDKDLRMKITSYRFSPMGRKLKSIGFGKIKTSLTQQVSNIATEVAEQSVSVAGQVFEEKLQKEIENADKVIDGKINKVRDEINDGLEQSKAEAEAYADNIKQRIDGQLAESDRQYQLAQQTQGRQIADVLAKATAAKEIAEQTVTDLMRVQNAFNQSIGQANTKALELERSIGTVRTDVMSQAQTILAQAQTQTELTNRVTTVETLADGTKTTVAELSKTVSKATGDITSVTSRTKTVEETLSQTRTQYEALTQTVNTQTGQIESINRKTADLQSGIDGVTERFESLRVGATNYIRDFGFAKNHNFSSYQSIWQFERISDSTARSGYLVKATCTQAGGAGFYRRFFDLRGEEWQGRTMTYAVDIKASKSVRMRLGAEAFNKSYRAFDVTTDWQRFVSTDTVNYKTDYGFTFYIDGAQWQVGDIVYIRDPQLEDGSIATTPHASEEDLRSEFATYVRNAAENSAELVRRIETADGKAVDVKTYAQQTATAINTRLESLETYKNAEGTRASQYFSASRDETARKVTALRTAVTDGYVAKAKYEEDARGVMQRFESLSVDQQSYTDIKIAEYKTTVDGRFATMQTSIDSKASQVAFQRVQETSQLYERIIGSTETGIKDKVARMVMADSLFLTEVKDKISGTATQVSQLNNSYAIKNLTSAGTVLNQINLLANGTNRIDGRLTHITGQTLIDNGVIKNAMIGNLDAGKINTGTLNAARIATNSIDGSKLVFDQAFVNKMTANEALFKQLFAKNAFITSVQAVTLSASQITGGLMRATNRAMEVNLNAGQILYYTDQAALKRVLNGYPTQFVKFATGTVTGKGNAGVTVIGSNRWNSESSNDGGFVGIRAWNGPNIDQIDVVGDTVRLASSAFEAADGWNINTLPGKLDIDAFNADHRASSKIKVGDLWLWKNATTYSSMRDTINLIIDNLQLLHNNKSTERGYSYTLPAKV